MNARRHENHACMTLDDVLSRIGGKTFGAALSPHWDDSSSSLPEGPLPFLVPSAAHSSRAWCGLHADADAILDKAAKAISSDAALRLLAWHAYRRLHDWPEDGGFNNWPTLEAPLGDLCGCFYLLIGLSIVPKVRELHASMGIAERVTRDTCGQVSASALNYRRGWDGRLGIPKEQLHWYHHYLAGRLFRLDRFEFKLERFRPQCHVFRHRRAGHVVALATGVVRYTADGLAVREDVPADLEGSWTTDFELTDEYALGYPIAPNGCAIPQQVRLPLEAWAHVTPADEFTLDMHIPAGGDMTHGRCVNSMRQGVTFFRRHFPEKSFATISCSSWIYGPQLEDVLPSTANLVRHMREVYLFPVSCAQGSGLWFIFLRDPVDLATAPRVSSLQRAVANHLDAGGAWRAGGMFFLVDDLDHYGSRHYRAQWPSAAKSLEVLAIP